MDFETIFFLALPMLTLPSHHTGSCCLHVEIDGERGRSSAGVMVEVDEGRVVSCTSRVAGSTSAASASPEAWLKALIRGTPRGFDVRDRGGLAPALLESLHGSLFG
jgi:hypothetical protein